MISNERPSPFPPREVGQAAPRAQVLETTLQSEKVQIERKVFVFSLRENPRGRFLRITEDINGRRDSIIVPATGLVEFKRVIDVMLEVDAATAEAPPEPPQA